MLTVTIRGSYYVTEHYWRLLPFYKRLLEIIAILQESDEDFCYNTCDG